MLEKWTWFGKIMLFVIYICYHGELLILELNPLYFILSYLNYYMNTV